MDEKDLRDLGERVELINAMVSQPGWQMLLDRARVTMLYRQTKIIQGRCKDYDDYVKECSFTDGMEFIMTLPQRTQSELDTALAEAEMAIEEEEEDTA